MMRSSARGGLRVGAFALLLWLPTGGSPVQAATQLSCRSSARFDPAGPAGVVEDLADTAGSCSSHVTGDVATLDAAGEADFGVLHATASGSFLDGAAELALASTAVQFRDQLEVDSDGLAGEIGVVHASVHLAGVLDIGMAGEASALLNVNTAFASSQLFFADCLPNSPCAGMFPYPAVIGESIDFAFNVQFGQTGLLGVSLTTTASRPAVATGAGFADAVFENTLTWGGIQQVTYQGSPVAFTVSSESGFDYAAAVPEPDSPRLLLVGGSVLAAARGRRSGRASPAAAGVLGARA
jgi:hypothetical protein